MSSDDITQFDSEREVVVMVQEQFHAAVAKLEVWDFCQ
jgi:hypothetical protein